MRQFDGRLEREFLLYDDDDGFLWLIIFQNLSDGALKAAFTEVDEEEIVHKPCQTSLLFCALRAMPANVLFREKSFFSNDREGEKIANYNSE